MELAEEMIKMKVNVVAVQEISKNIKFLLMQDSAVESTDRELISRAFWRDTEKTGGDRADTNEDDVMIKPKYEEI